MSVSTSQALVW